MSASELLQRLRQTGVELSADGEELVVRTQRRMDEAVLEEVRRCKAQLLELVRSAPPDAPRAPLVDLSAADLEKIGEHVTGGVANIQDVYPLAPLQEGILFHHLLATAGDPYLLPMVLSFAQREELDRYVAALRSVIARHDVLRTAVAWDGLAEPLQVVWREAPLDVEDVTLDPAGDVAEQLYRRFEPRRHRIDLRRAPLMRLYAAPDPAHARWVLLWLRHHLVSDHTTLDLLKMEIEAHVLGRAETLLPPLPFRDFVARTQLGVSRAEHERFFTALLGDVDEPTAPFGLLDVYGDGLGVFEARRPVDAALVERLQVMARSLGVSVATLCHVAWAQVLARVCGRADVVFGTVLFGRLHGGAGAERVLGPFINTLPVRLRVGAESVTDAARRTHTLLAELLHHEHASLALAQRCSGVKPPAPLFSSLLNYRHGRPRAAQRARMGAASAMRTLYAEERSNYPVTITIDDLRERLLLTTKAPTSVDAERLCEFMGTALERLVTALATTPHVSLERVDVLPAPERARVVREWNATTTPYPSDHCIHELFEAQVDRAPHAAAVMCDDRALTYAELNASANQLAHELRARGVGPDARVGLCAERGVDLLVAVLAILKAGGAYVPLDPAYPVERLRYMVADSAPALVLVHQSLRDRVGAAAGDLLVLDAPQPVWGRRPAINLARAALMPAHLAYVLYTSGSTGQPKGVMTPHRGVVNRLTWARAAWGLDASDAILGHTSLGFDGSLRELIWPLMAGARVVIPRPTPQPDPDVLLEAMREGGVTILNVVPALLQLLLERMTPASLPRLRQVLCGGDVFSRALLDHVHTRLPGVTVRNLYGPTEAATALTALECDAHETHVSVSLGAPIGNTRVYLLDPLGEPVPAGAAGELYIGGAGVARGYIDRPALTAERFVPDPFGEEPGGRLYRTGDLLRWSSDGTLDFVGRNDFQVKIRGHRVELGEVEATLRAHRGVSDVVVAAPADGSGDRRLVAYYVAASTRGPMPSAEALRSHVAAALPTHMVPSAYVRLDALPLSAHGKVDRVALPDPEADACTRSAYEPPRTELELTVAELWIDVLKLDRVGRTDHFFELGGHSLLAAQLISRVRQVLGRDPSIADVFTRPILADFARGLEATGRSELPPIHHVERTDRLPLSSAQQRLWFLAQLGAAGAAYHIPKSLRFTGALDAGALRAALDRIVVRHEVLRTTFGTIDGEPVQRIASAQTSRFALVEWDLGERADAEGELRQLALAEARAPFDLQTGPLIRGQLLRLSPADHVLLVTMHHIVSDAWSMGVFIRELGALYTAFHRGNGDPLPPLPIQYADYAVWQQQWMTGTVLQAQADFWRSTMAGAAELLAVPTDRPRPVQQDVAGAYTAVVFDAALTAGLKTLCRRHGVTLFMTLVAAWTTVLSRLAGQTDVVIGTPTANRTSREVEGLIGFFLNVLPLRVDLSRSPSVTDLLRRVRTCVLDAQRHQDMPFEQIVDLVQPARHMSHHPLFQMALVWQNVPREVLSLPGVVGIAPGRPPGVTAKFDLALNLHEVGGQIRGAAVFATALFDVATIERHVGYLRRVLEAMVADDTQMVDALPLLSDAERLRVTELWNATVMPLPADRCLHELFEAQVDRTPDAVAVMFNAHSLSYAELNARANQLAHELRALGVAPGARVALCVERSVELAVGLLAILKAGGAYVPLDPAYPTDRLQYMLVDGAPAVVLTQRALRERFADATTPVLVLDAPTWQERPTRNPRRGALTAAHCAYVIYTSGSTGRPKGVVVAHRSIVNALSWAQAYWALGPDESVLQRMSPSFDVAVRELCWPLTTGARAVLLSPDAQADVHAMVDTIARAGITTVHVVPSLLREMLDDGAILQCATLKRVLCGGEALPALLARRFAERLPAATLYHMYGPTETTVAVTMYACPHSQLPPHVPLGRPVANTSVYILDSSGGLVPAGVAGELCIGGVQVADGYLARPGDTARRFLPDPFSGESGARLYHTGDIGRWLADGTLEFLGRNDAQVKVRGHRIELGEIEARLMEHGAVREAAVVVREDIPGDRRLIAYYVVVPGAEERAPSAGSIHEALAERLPAYMLPAAYVRLDALPLTPNGKLDRRRLPVPSGDAFAAAQYEAPAGETERRLATIWADILRVDRVGRHDSFFDLGGHSLLATKLVFRVKQEMDVDLPLRDVFEMPVLSILAEHLLNAQLARFDPVELARLERRMRGESPG